MFNVADKASQVFEKLEKEGFGGRDVIASQKCCVWHEQYAYFSMCFDSPFLDDDEYISYDYDRWNRDFREYLESEFPDCKVTIQDQCQSYEIEGPKSKEFWDKYRDDIELFSEQHSEERHQVYVPTT